METRDKRPHVTTVYVDRLSLAASVHLFRQTGILRVIALEKISRLQKFWTIVLRSKGITLAEAVFFAGHLKTEDGESVYFASRRLANAGALKAAERVVESEPDICEVNRTYGRNTVRLFISKQLSRHIEQWTSRMLVARSLGCDERCGLLLAKPRRFDERLLAEVISSVKLQFYNDRVGGAKDLAREILFSILKIIKQRYAFNSSEKDGRTSPHVGLLVMQEESLRAANHLRNQLYFLDRQMAGKRFNTFILKAPNGSLFQDDERDLKSQRVFVLPFTALGSALREFRNDKNIKRLKASRRRLFRGLFRTRSYSGKWFSLKVGFLLWQAEMMAALCLKNRIGVFVTKEPSSAYADAIQLIAADLSITTIALQYSNTPFVSPGMISTADKHVVFSEMYKSVFAVDGIAPGEFLTNGYLYDGIAEAVSDRATNHRRALERHGAKFIVCYFDESVQHDRWGLVSTEDHLGDLHTLARAVLSDPDFGVVVKSQFMRNSPSQLHPSDELMRKAQATGRYLELREGAHRNDVYPTEAALVADLCVGHKFGATAAVEAAIAGLRTVILDTYGTRTCWDAIYAQANIEFETIDDVLEATKLYRAGSMAQESLGDWTPILHHFDAFRDGRAVTRTMKIVEDCIVARESLSM